VESLTDQAVNCIKLLIIMLIANYWLSCWLLTVDCIYQISHSEAAGLPVGTIVYIKYFGTDSASGEERWSRRALLSAGYLFTFLPPGRHMLSLVN